MAATGADAFTGIVPRPSVWLPNPEDRAMQVTEDEWAERQAQMPEGARRMHARISEATRARVEEADRRRAAETAAEIAHWERFEQSLGLLLEAEGGDWLHEFRVTDPARLALQDLHPSDFAAHCKAWVAVFDTRRVGHYPIRVIFHHGAGGWTPAANPFTVERPDGTRSFRSLEAAVDFAARFCSVPF
jgi:hypothetical protein